MFFIVSYFMPKTKDYNMESQQGIFQFFVSLEPSLLKEDVRAPFELRKSVLLLISGVSSWMRLNIIENTGLELKYT